MRIWTMIVYGLLGAAMCYGQTPKLPAHVADDDGHYQQYVSGYKGAKLAVYYKAKMLSDELPANMKGDPITQPHDSLLELHCDWVSTTFATDTNLDSPGFQNACVMHDIVHNSNFSSRLADYLGAVQSLAEANTNMQAAWIVYEVYIGPDP